MIILFIIKEPSLPPAAKYWHNFLFFSILARSLSFVPAHALQAHILTMHRDASGGFARPAQENTQHGPEYAIHRTSRIRAAMPHGQPRGLASRSPHSPHLKP
ncbi:MAG: hypothetical protein OXE80_07470 [Gammaproteobacteria bacterium]|nr:hypothetical protein [Gammaproteobacteria bacterium]